VFGYGCNLGPNQTGAAARTAIADATHVKLRENNLIGFATSAYGGYGGIAYHHIADTYITLFPASFPAVYGRPFTSWMA
jgi:hypothetical protein